MTLNAVPPLQNPTPILSVSPSTKTSKPIQFYISALNYDVGLDVSGVLNNVLVPIIIKLFESVLIRPVAIIEDLFV